MSYRRAAPSPGIAVLALALGMPCSAESSGPSKAAPAGASAARRVEAIVETGRRELHIPGISVAIMRGQEVTLAKGYGEADHEAGTPATERTIYAIGSLSKQFTAAAVLKLNEEGRLQLDEPVSKYITGFRGAQASVPTIRSLLQQNSGLPAWDDLPEFEDVDSAKDPRRFELPRLVEAIGRQPSLYAPGEWWSYSNSNYTLLAAVVERITGVTHDEYLKRAFFDRMGLRSLAGCAASGGPRAVGYQDSRSYAVRQVTAVKAKAFTGAGGLCGDVMDLAAWMRALVDGRAVSADSFGQMTTPAPVRAGFTPPYGFGVSLLPLAGQRTIWHAGVLSGYTAILAYLPEHDLVVAALANARRARLEQVVKDVVRGLLGLRPPRLKDLPIDPREATRIAGDYDDRMFKFRVVQKGRELFVDVPPSGGPTRLMRQRGREFATGRPTDFRLRFEPENGDVERIVWEWVELRAYGRRVR